MTYEDISKVEIETKTMKYTISTKPPHNMYYISVSKGFVPKALKGAFTNIESATKTVKNYLLDQGKEEKH